MAKTPQPSQPYLQPSEPVLSPGVELQPEPVIVGDANPILESLNAALAYGDMLVQQSANENAKK